MAGNPYEQLPGNRQPWAVSVRYKALVLPSVLHDLPAKYLKALPIFNGEDEATAEKHIAAFQDYTDYLGIEHDDVFMRIFTHSLHGECRKWFRNLAAESITSSMDFFHIFLDKWGKKKIHHFSLKEFYTMKRNKAESLSQFNRRFAKFYSEMPADIQPSEAAAKVYYAAAHESDFSFHLRERRSPTLGQMFNDALELHNNLLASGKVMRIKVNDQTLRKQKEVGKQVKHDFHHIFLDKWEEKNNHHFYLTEFYAMKRNDAESLSQFNRRFEKFYHEMPADIRPSEADAKVYYAAAHESDFSFYLRERRSSTLGQMFKDALKLENNLLDSGKVIRDKLNDQTLRKQNEEGKQVKHDSHHIFLDKWEEKKSHHFYLKEFYALIRNEAESLSQFNRRFEKFYREMPAEIQPSEAAAKVYYAAAHESDFSIYLRERRSPTLCQMFKDALELEYNLLASGKVIRNKVNDQTLSKQKEDGKQVNTSSVIPPVSKSQKLDVDGLITELQYLNARGEPAPT